MLFSIWALALSLMGASAPRSDTAPVRLIAEPQGDGMRLTVLGESDVAVQAGYALEVESGAAAGGNRTVQRGQVSLRPGVAETLMTLNLGNVAGGSWTARLRVEPVGEIPYEQVRRSPTQD